MILKFTKMHGLGNDFMVVDGVTQKVFFSQELIKKLADRHFGIGADGIILIQDSDVADFKMRIFNQDGSEAEMCGNGIRCVGKYVYDNGLTDKKDLIDKYQSIEKEISQLKIKEVKANKELEYLNKLSKSEFYILNSSLSYDNLSEQVCSKALYWTTV